MAKRSSTKLEFEIRQADGSFQPLTLMLHPPNDAIVEELAISGAFNPKDPGTNLGDLMISQEEMAAKLLSRFDPEHGNAEWLRKNLEPDDLRRLQKAVVEMLSSPDDKGGSDPNAVSP